MREVPRVIGVQMGEHDLADVARPHAHLLQLGADLVVWRHPELRRAAIKRMPARMIAPLMHPRRFTGIDENQSFVVLDEPRMDRGPVRPISIEQDVAETPMPAAASHLWLIRTDPVRIV